MLYTNHQNPRPLFAVPGNLGEVISFLLFLEVQELSRYMVCSSKENNEHIIMMENLGIWVKQFEHGDNLKK